MDLFSFRHPIRFKHLLRLVYKQAKAVSNPHIQVTKVNLISPKNECLSKIRISFHLNSCITNRNLSYSKQKSKLAKRTLNKTLRARSSSSYTLKRKQRHKRKERVLKESRSEATRTNLQQLNRPTLRRFLKSSSSLCLLFKSSKACLVMGANNHLLKTKTTRARHKRQTR